MKDGRITLWGELASLCRDVIEQRNEARAWACRLYRRVQELENDLAWHRTELVCARAAVLDTYRDPEQEDDDIDALIETLAHILAHDMPKRGWGLFDLSASLRARVEAAAAAEWDNWVQKRG